MGVGVMRDETLKLRKVNVSTVVPYTLVVWVEHTILGHSTEIADLCRRPLLFSY